MRTVTAEGLRALSDAKPTTVFEQIAAQIVVEVAHHNGGLYGPDQFFGPVTLFEVLKYPNAFDITSHLKAMNDPKNAPTWDGEFKLGPF